MIDFNKVLTGVFQFKKAEYTHLRTEILQDRVPDSVLSSQDSNNRTLMHYAAYYQDRGLIQHLLYKGMDHKQVDYKNRTPQDFALELATKTENAAYYPISDFLGGKMPEKIRKDGMIKRELATFSRSHRSNNVPFLFSQVATGNKESYDQLKTAFAGDNLSQQHFLYYLLSLEVTKLASVVPTALFDCAQQANALLLTKSSVLSEAVVGRLYGAASRQQHVKSLVEMAQLDEQKYLKTKNKDDLKKALRFYKRAMITREQQCEAVGVVNDKDQETLVTCIKNIEGFLTPTLQSDSRKRSRADDEGERTMPFLDISHKRQRRRVSPSKQVNFAETAQIKSFERNSPTNEFTDEADKPLAGIPTVG